MIVAILQARSSSSRLPDKVLKPILGKPMLLHQIERVLHSRMIDKLVIATSVHASDNDIERMCLNKNIEVFRGSLNNVLDRFYQCATMYNPTYIVRLTGDCPLADWQIIDKTIQYCLDGNFDYAVTDPNFPDGLDAEIMTMSALKEAHQYASLPSEIEHVTQYIHNRPGKFKLGKFKSTQDLHHLRLTVDEPEDFILVEKIYESLYSNPLFLTQDVLRLLEKNPDMININNNISRNVGLKKSIQEDKDYLQNV
jgi:spore coat polysaccharide biosynthesis protein SpsF